MKNGLVTIITTCYNGEKYLEKYFQSLINQTYKSIQVIFVNDGSVDMTEKIAKRYGDILKERGIYFNYIYEENGGQAAAINLALPNVEGEFLYWMDVDDYCEQDAIEGLVQYLQKNQDYNIVRGKVKFWYNGKEIGVGKPRKDEGEYIFENYLLGKNSYCFAGIFMIRMNEFDKNIKNRKIYNSREGQNWQLILPNIYNQKCGFVDKIVYNYNIIQDSHSHKINTYKEEIKKLNGHKDILENVIKSIENMDEKYRKKILKKVKRKYNKSIFKERIKDIELVKFIRGKSDRSS